MQNLSNKNTLISESKYPKYSGHVMSYISSVLCETSTLTFGASQWVPKIDYSHQGLIQDIFCGGSHMKKLKTS